MHPRRVGGPAPLGRAAAQGEAGVRGRAQCDAAGLAGAARISSFFAALTQELRCTGTTTLFGMETPRLFGPVLDVPMEVGPSAVAENLFFLRHVELEGRLRRLLSIFKMRDTHYDPTLREFVITSQGIEVLPPFSVAVDTLLTGLARHPGAGHF
ncbi:RAD55 family ATPase [Myxococcus sp. 1LA]